MKKDGVKGLRGLFSLPADLPIGEKERIEISKKGSLRTALIEGVHRILLYGAQKMIFSMSDGRIEVDGEALDCATYMSGAICITGEIKGISFYEGGGEKN